MKDKNVPLRVCLAWIARIAWQGCALVDAESFKGVELTNWSTQGSHQKKNTKIFTHCESYLKKIENQL